jgi:hypothetical protein
MKIHDWCLSLILSIAAFLPFATAAEPLTDVQQKLLQQKLEEQKLIEQKLQYDKQKLPKPAPPVIIIDPLQKLHELKAAGAWYRPYRPYGDHRVLPPGSDRPDGQQPEPGMPEVRRGAFTVTIVGFNAQTQTADDLLENDGRGDEVFLRAATILRNREVGDTSAFVDFATKTFGDINRHPGRRLEAGHAGDRGGLRSGDSFPPLNPAAPAAGDARGDRLPLMIFGGTLVENRDLLIVAPTIYEWDDLGDPPAFFGAVGDVERPMRPWHEGGDNDRAGQLQRSIFRAMTRIADAASHLDPAALADRPVRSGTALGFPLTSGDRGGNRPIGMIRDGDGTPVFTPKALVLDFASAERLADMRFTFATRGAGETGRITLPAGVVPVRYLDDEGLNGDYTIFVHIARGGG